MTGLYRLYTVTILSPVLSSTLIILRTDNMTGLRRTITEVRLRIPDNRQQNPSAKFLLVLLNWTNTIKLAISGQIAARLCKFQDVLSGVHYWLISIEIMWKLFITTKELIQNDEHIQLVIKEGVARGIRVVMMHFLGLKAFLSPRKHVDTRQGSCCNEQICPRANNALPLSCKDSEQSTLNK